MTTTHRSGHARESSIGIASSTIGAGPSRPYFPIPFRLDTARDTPTAPQRAFGQVAGPSSYRGATPIRPRSSSTYSARTQADEDAALLDRKRADSVKKMVTSWDLLREKYGAVGLNEDDEIDIRTGEILKNRGRLKMMEPRKDIGEDSEDEDETQTVVSEQREESVDPDEDELGGWDEKSGLDPQTRQLPPQRVWTDQDQEDLKQFLRAEAERKGLVSDAGSDEEEEDEWSSDEDGAQADGSRTASPTSDQDGSASESEESEDELLAFDQDATRKTPVPPRPRQDGLEVIIPPWSSRPIAKAPSASSSPTTTAAHSKTVPAPRSLRDLFTPPPTSSDPLPPSPTIQPPHANIESPSMPVIVQQQSKRPSARSRSGLAATPDLQKGKARMSGERPLPTSQSRSGTTSRTPDLRLEDMEAPADRRYYRPALSMTGTGTYRYCWVCRGSSNSPARREKAHWCKGRHDSRSCVFARELGENTVHCRTAARIARLGSALRESKSDGDLRSSSVSNPDAFGTLGGTAKERAGPVRSFEDRGETTSTAVDGSPKGNRYIQPISYMSLRSKKVLRIIQPLSIPSRAVLEPEIPPPQPTDSDGESWASPILELLPREMRDLSDEPPTLRLHHGKQLRSASKTTAFQSLALPKAECPLCRRAGGEREREASECKGRKWSRKCPYYTEPAVAEPDIQPGTTVPSMTSTETRLRNSPESMSPIPVRDGMKSARKRIVTPISISPAPKDIFTEMSESSQTTLPPSSPPESSPFTVRPASTHSHPTPSPTVSVEPDKRDPTQALLWPPTSPLARRILPLPRGSHYAIHPTPPPSTASRASSLASDHLSSVRPRSILRGPPSIGSSGGSMRNSLKRARFSLRPSSPGVDSSDAFGPSDTESQDLDYESSSPWQNTFPGDEEEHQVSSPFFSREVSVRAADAGHQLGLGHTGRITPGIMQALYPKYGAPLAMDSSSPDSAGSTPITTTPYTLPVPPRRISTPTRSARSPSKTSTAGLMLPPPVPTNRLGSANSSTPGPLPPLRSSVEPTPPIKSPKTPTIRRPAPITPVRDASPDRPIIFRTALPARIVQAQARARSRSVSAVPTSSRRPGSGQGGEVVGNGMTRRSVGPASTPRKRYRDRSERELARLARELGDDAGLEWGMDEDVGQEIAREGRKGTVFMYLE